MRYYYIFLFVIISGVSLSGCKNRTDSAETMTDNVNGQIVVTRQQFDSEGMAIGNPVLKAFENVVSCNGYIKPSAGGIAQISSPVQGVVESVQCKTGEYVKKGQVLCMISGKEMLSIQQDYAETNALLKKTESEYERAKILFDENVGSEKDFIAIESDYNAMKARKSTLLALLRQLNLDGSKIESGAMYSSFPVIAPINGYITVHNLVMGLFTEKQMMLVEIVDITRLQLELSVFENDIATLKKGQIVRFSSVNETPLLHEAVIESIGKAVNPETKTISCIATIKNESGTEFINNAFVKAEIVTDVVESLAIPIEAVLKSENTEYLFVVEKSDSQEYYVRRVPVKTGMVSGEYSEITAGEELKNVIISGVYNLQSE